MVVFHFVRIKLGLASPPTICVAKQRWVRCRVTARLSLVKTSPAVGTRGYRQPGDQWGRRLMGLEFSRIWGHTGPSCSDQLFSSYPLVPGPSEPSFSPARNSWPRISPSVNRFAHSSARGHVPRSTMLTALSGWHCGPRGQAGRVASSSLIPTRSRSGTVNVSGAIGRGYRSETAALVDRESMPRCNALPT